MVFLFIFSLCMSTLQGWVERETLRKLPGFGLVGSAGDTGAPNQIYSRKGGDSGAELKN